MTGFSNNLVSIAKAYVDKPNESFTTEEVKGGWLACAKVVSTILKDAGMIDKIYIRVEDIIEALKADGWRETTIGATGDVVVWDKTDDYPYLHVGIVSGSNEAINNSSYAKMPITSKIDERPVLFYLTKNEQKAKAPVLKNIEFTSYNPEIGQTDNNPCVGASTEDQCERAGRGDRIIALSRDLVSGDGSKAFTYGDVVELRSQDRDTRCNGRYVVLDTMAKRYTMRGDIFFMDRSNNVSCVSDVYKIS